MILLQDISGTRFAELGDGCSVLIEKECEGCKFYKPEDCEDWVRVERNGVVALYPPEEYREVFTPKEVKPACWVITKRKELTK